MIKLTLKIFIHTGRQGLYSLYGEGICELSYNEFSIKRNDTKELNIYAFPVWENIQAKTIGEIKIENNEFYEVELTSKSWNRFCILKKHIQKLTDFCDKRNQKMLFNKENIYKYIDTNVLNIAENLLNIVAEDIMINYRILARCHIIYSHTESKIFKRNCSINEKYSFRYELSKDIYRLKGKDKKDAEKFNEELWKNIRELTKLIDNFVEIIIEEKKVNENIAKAVAWEAIQRKSIEYYSKKWIDEFEINLTKSYNEFFNQYIGDFQIAKDIQRNYIKNVLVCDEINIENSQEILIYFLLSKCNIKELILCDCFVEYYEIIQELKQNIESSDIKQKLKTKQKRKITKYTIDDIDLMNGTEFEKFVALLFKKMGYSSQVTKQSGDQGIDVIAIKNNTQIGIQAKCYSNTIGNAAIQEAVAGKSYYDCDKVVVVTNNYFTTAAIELAQANNVILWNRDFLKEKIKEIF